MRRVVAAAGWRGYRGHAKDAPDLRPIQGHRDPGQAAATGLHPVRTEAGGDNQPARCKQGLKAQHSSITAPGIANLARSINMAFRPAGS